MAEIKEEVQIDTQPATSTSTTRSGKRGMAPFASLEDLSDDSPPDDKVRLTLPGIREDPSPTRTGITPRIDISRASSSSHHDDSSPERELFAGSSNGGAKIGLGFTEEMAVELRNSTEELDFQDPEEETKSRRKKLHQQHAVGFVHITKHELDAETDKTSGDRKDSTCSEGGLLLIGGRTSRLSSIGSAGSAASHVSVGSAISGHSHLSAVSHLSGQSHLSAVSNASGSRCSSPHKMLLETSFCGPKPIPTLSLEAEYPPTESVEATLLARKTDITGAVLPNDDSIKIPASRKSSVASSKGTKSNTLEVTRLKARSSSERLTGPRTHHVQTRSSSERGNLKSRIKIEESDLIKIIPLHGSLDEPDDNTVDTTESDNVQGETTSSTYTPEHGIYIPLKGPLIDPVKQETTIKKPEGRSKKVEIQESDLVRFISLHGEDDEDIQRARTSPSSSSSTPGRSCQNVQFKPWPNEYAQYSQKDRISKKPATPRSSSAHDSKSKSKPSTLDVQTTKRPTQSLTCLAREGSRTPSPATSFTKGALFRRSSDSSSSSKKSANTSGSSDSRTKKDSKNKSMFTSLFKKNIKESPTQQKSAQESKPAPIDSKFSNVEFKFKQEEADQIIIPLHSPDDVTKPSLTMNAEDAITTDSGGEYDNRLSKKDQTSREFAKKETDVLRTMKALENKNIIVVDVINADTAVCYEAVIETPRGGASSSRSGATSPKPVEKHQVVVTGKDKPRSPSLATQPLELETLESEPRVRVASRRSSRTSTMGLDMYGFAADELPEVVAHQPVPSMSQPGDVKDMKSETTEQLSTEVSIETEDKKISLETSSVKSQASHKDESEEKRSSESEMEGTIASVEDRGDCEEERKGLFNQAESVEEELPYVPTTLPLERSVAVPIVPVNQRMTEVRTCPVDRPRSTTPIQPSNLEEYAATHDNTRRPSTKTEKMQIILPRTDSIGKSRSPGKALPWSKWAEECLQSPKEIRRGDKIQTTSRRTSSSPPPPPLPPRSATAGASTSTPPPPPPPPPLSSNGQSWVIFDEPHEQERRPVRRITTLPVRHVQTAAPSQATLVYSYVNPEECSCECHEVLGKVNSSANRNCSSNQTDACSGPPRTDKDKRHKT